MALSTHTHEAEFLTPRESEILQCLIDCCNVPELARRLGLAPATIRQHLHRMKAKLQMNRVAVPKSAAFEALATNDGETSKAGFPNLADLQPVCIMAIRPVPAPIKAVDDAGERGRSLAAVSEKIRLHIRAQDWLGRAGPEVVLVVLSRTDSTVAQHVGRRLRQELGVCAGINVQQWMPGESVEQVIAKVTHAAHVEALGLQARRTLTEVQNL